MERMNPEELEKLVHTTLRSLPNRRAPATLESRVLAALERQAAIPWWHKSWSYWPQWARAVFLVFCGGLAGLLVFAGVYLQTGFDSVQFHQAAAPALTLIRGLLGAGRGLVDFVALLVRQIPTWWLYGAAAFVVMLYGMLFGLGAAAYRTLWSHR